MTRCVANVPVDTAQLLEYWLGELDEAAEQRIDEHLFACAACSARLRALVDLGAAIRGELTRGALDIVLPEPFIARIKEAGLRVREYALEPGGHEQRVLAHPAPRDAARTARGRRRCARACDRGLHVQSLSVFVGKVVAMPLESP